MNSIPVFAALGNHEFYPVNVMTINEQDPLLTEIAEIWRPYLDTEALETFKRYGYFSQNINSTNPLLQNIKVISLNSA